MKKFLVNLSAICLLAALTVPMVGCKKEEAPVNNGMATDMAPVVEPAVTEPMSTDMAPMSTDAMSTDTMSTDVTPMSTDVPPAQ